MIKFLRWANRQGWLVQFFVVLTTALVIGIGSIFSRRLSRWWDATVDAAFSTKAG